MAADITGVKRLLLRKFSQGSITLDYLHQLAEQAGEAQLQGKASVEITSLAGDSATSGMLVMSSNELLVLIMDILDVVDPCDTTAPRKAFVRADFSRCRAPFDLNPYPWL